MGISIYYAARREKPLTDTEQKEIDRLIAEYSVDKEIEDYNNWETFCVYDKEDPSECNIIFEGATRLPDNSKEALWEGVQHWSLLLAAIRNRIQNAEWHVHVDDHELVWDEKYSEYDLSK